MTEIVLTEGFLEDMRIVQREEKTDEILDRISLLESSPEIGSALLPPSIVRKYGPQVRKLIVMPFDVIYEYMLADDTVVVLALVHQRSVY